MASARILFLLILCILHGNVRAQENQSQISFDSSIHPTDEPASWLSPSGLFAFGFYAKGDIHDDGFAIGIWLIGPTENTVVWTANRDDPPISSSSMLQFTKDGGLILTNENGIKKSVLDVTMAAHSASMLDSGNFVLYDNSSNVIWESFDFPTDTILGGQNLSTGQLVSSASKLDHRTGRFFLSMQGDGNLVSYPVNNPSDDAYWSYWLSHGSRTHLCLDDRGNLFLQSYSTMHILGNGSSPSNNKTIIYRATLDADGVFRLYSHHFDNGNRTVLTEWSNMEDQCKVFGYCGFNSYCSNMNTEGECNCYPGFTFIDPINKYLGCYKNSSEDDCRGGYNVRPISMVNILWHDYPYSSRQMTQVDCAQSCVEDCNCGAALYDYETGKCKTYKLPLRYGRTENISATAFFKLNLGKNKTERPQDPFKTDNNKSLILILSTILGSVACLCFVIALCSYFMYMHRLRRYKRLSKDENLGLKRELALRLFSYSELEKATNGFKEELGRGSNRKFYKGNLLEGNKAIAVKRLGKAADAKQREFHAEMTVIGRFHHKNLVRLLGFCIQGCNRLLVYEYMSNGSLADLIFKGEKRPLWKERVKIALDVARGIFYLHEECDVHIIHCNIKPQNILMDDSRTAKISDFESAKLLMLNQNGAIMEVRGTGGYLAPEWQKKGLITLKADIYSFGVVLMEILCCRSMIEVEVSTEDEIILTSWVHKCYLSGELNKLVEGENVDMRTLERMVKVGLWCIQDDPALRPTMKNVILMLEGTMDAPILPTHSALSFVAS